MNLQDIQDISGVLPPALMLGTMPYAPRTPDSVRAERAQFMQQYRPLFLKHVAAAYGPALVAMGLTHEAIAAMADTGDLPRIHAGEQLDASVDHVHSLHAGGTNDMGNMMLIPARFNALKDKIEQAQLRGQTTPPTDLITILPRDAAPVPFIAGGFKRSGKLT